MKDEINDTTDDEEIARQLQDQFRHEVEQYASSSAWSQLHTVFTPDDVDATDVAINIDSIPVVDGIPDDEIDTPPTKKKFRHDLSFETESTSPSSLDGTVDRSASVASTRASIDEFVEVDIDIEREEEMKRQRQQRRDEELARRLEREMRDEALARQLRASQEFVIADSLQTENDAVLARQLQREAEVNGRGVRRNGGRGVRAQTTTQKIIYYGSRALSIILVICVTYLVFMMVWGQNVNSGLDPSSWLPGWPEGDPNLGSVGENNIWDMNGNFQGLTLQVLNNLDEGSDWHQYFEASVTEWNDGTPDAVNLYLRFTSYDPDCRAVRKAMKVCNGNYGPTDWRGVNQILLQDEYIITSLAKMNDYYLEGTNMAQKQYTMCHELGHGLGLGHTDENFYNKDLGNCMDYTERPQNNMHPDESNFQQLEELYGNVDGTSVRPTSQNWRVRARRTAASLKDDQTLDDEFEYYSKFLSDPIQVPGADQLDGSRLLFQTDRLELYERNLGNGYVLRTSFLRAL